MAEGTKSKSSNAIAATFRQRAIRPSRALNAAIGAHREPNTSLKLQRSVAGNEREYCITLRFTVVRLYGNYKPLRSSGTNTHRAVFFYAGHRIALSLGLKRFYKCVRAPMHAKCTNVDTRLHNGDHGTLMKHNRRAIDIEETDGRA